MKAWLTLPEYLVAANISRRTFFYRRASIETRVIDDVTKYSAASIPTSTTSALVDLKGLGEPVASSNTAATGPLFASVDSAPQASQNTRIVLTPEGEKQAEQRLRILQPLLDFIENPSCRARYAMLKLADGSAVTNSNLMAAYLVEQHGGPGMRLSRSTLWNWKKAYTEGGYQALARGTRSDKGQSKWFAKHPDAAQLVASVYLKPYQSVATAYNALLRECPRMGLTEVDLPSYETVRTYLDALPPAITVLARQGERAYSERMTPYLQRGYEDVPANHTWVADHMIHDVEVRNDCFEGVAEDAPMRLRFSAFLDMRTRKFVGYCWAPEGNSRVITTAVRRGIESYGPPQVVYCDNGKDYQKVAKGARPASVEMVERDFDALAKTGALQRLGVAVQFCMPYHPQSKLIERAFRTVHQKFDAMFPHYTTGNAYLRPDQTTLAMATHRKLLRMGEGKSSPLMPASLFIRMATEWIENDYNGAHKHTGKAMGGRTPNQVFDELYPIEQRRSADPGILAQLLLETQKRRVRECAVVLHGTRYVPANAQSSAVMHLANETDVLLCYDPHDLDRAIIADLDGRMIAQVYAERLMPHSAAANEAIAHSMQERRRLRNATVRTVRQIHQNVALMGYKSDLQILAEHASTLPVAVGDTVVHRMKKVETHAVSAPQYAADIANQFFSEGD